MGCRQVERASPRILGIHVAPVKINRARFLANGELRYAAQARYSLEKERSAC